MTKLVKILQLNKLTKQQKENIYNRLLTDNHWHAEIDIFLDGAFYCTPDIEFYNNDLCVSHFGKNFYYRTQKAVKKERYNNLGDAITQLKRLIKNYYNCRVSYSNLKIYYRNKISKNYKNVFNIEL